MINGNLAFEVHFEVFSLYMEDSLTGYPWFILNTLATTHLVDDKWEFDI